MSKDGSLHDMERQPAKSEYICLEDRQDLTVWIKRFNFLAIYVSHLFFMDSGLTLSNLFCCVTVNIAAPSRSSISNRVRAGGRDWADPTRSARGPLLESLSHLCRK